MENYTNAEEIIKAIKNLKEEKSNIDKDVLLNILEAISSELIVLHGMIEKCEPRHVIMGGPPYFCA